MPAPPTIPQFTMGQNILPSFLHGTQGITNALGQWQARNQQADRLAQQQQQFEATNKLSQARLGMEQQQFAREQALAPELDPLRVRQAKATVAKLERSPETDSITEYNFARQNGFSGSFMDFQKVKAQGGVKFGLNPIPVPQPDGSIQYVVPNTRGGAQPLTLADGSPVSSLPKASSKIVGGAQYTTDQFGRTVEKRDVTADLSAGKTAQEVGEAQGKAKSNIPAVLSKGMEALHVLDTAIMHEGSPGNFGLRGTVPNIPGGKAADAWTYIQQAQGQVFLEAYESLKGAGQITEVEGVKAERAKARLQHAQGWDSAKRAMEELRGVIINGIRRTYVQAGLPEPTTEQLRAHLKQAEPSFTGRIGTQPSGQQPQGAPAAPAVPQGAIQMLRSNPNLAGAFDQKYGPGAAAAILGGR